MTKIKTGNFISIILILVVLMSLCACQSNSSKITSNGTENNQGANEDLDSDVTERAEEATNKPTDKETENSSDNETKETTETATEEVTEPITEAVTEEVTEAPTQPPTQAPTQPSTQAPTQPPTQAPTQPPAQAPTQSPAEASPTTQNEVDELIKRAVNEAVKPGMSEFERALAIHDWITYNIDYDYITYNSSLLTALKTKRGVCECYAQCFRAMAEQAGLEVAVVSGVADNGLGLDGHAWNQVRIDGVWYNVDTTWDDPGSSVKDPDDHSDNSYDYFLISDENIEKNHFPHDKKYDCSSDYSRETIFKTAAKINNYAGVVFTTEDDLAEKFNELCANGVDEFVFWYYDPALPDYDSNVFSSKFYALLKNVNYPIGLNTIFPPENGVAKGVVSKNMDFDEFFRTKVTKNMDEFLVYTSEQTANGAETFTVRCEFEENLCVDGYMVENVSKYGNNYWVRRYTKIN